LTIGSTFDVVTFQTNFTYSTLLYNKLGKETIQNSWRGVLAEFMGMIFVVLIGCGASAASEYFIEDPVSKLIFTAGTGGYTICTLFSCIQ
jgi:hypothetical protein